MRFFTTPFEKKYEDKIIGGKLSLRQALWYILPLVYLIKNISKVNQFMYNSNSGTHLRIDVILIKLTVVLLLTFAATIMSFFKYKNHTLDIYILKKISLKLRRNNIRFYE